MGQPQSHAPGFASRSARISATLIATAVLCLVQLSVTPAWAAMGYELDTVDPSLSLSGEKVLHGVAVDQTSQQIYVAVTTADPNVGLPGLIEQFNSNGTPTAASPFVVATSGSESIPLIGGVAVNPLTHGIYADQIKIQATPDILVGENKMLQFSSTGTQGASFATTNSDLTAPQIATDAIGRVYYPNDATNTVQVFNSSGVLQAEFGCNGCPGGPFQAPTTVAVDSNGSVYVVDAYTERVVKFTESAGGFTYSMTLQDDRGAGAVGVDPSTNDVFVGDVSPPDEYHVIAYTSLGVQYDDFGAGDFAPVDSRLGAGGSGQIAVNGTTHEVYVGDAPSRKVLIFDRVTINPPTVTTKAATSIGQLTATLNASTNPRGHALIECKFEYIDNASFGVNGYLGAASTPCSKLPGGSNAVGVTGSPADLTPSTGYHYRTVTANNAGQTVGGDQTFTTLPSVPPTVTTEAATSVKQTTATLVGKVNPHGGTASDCHFEYGQTLPGQSVPCPVGVGQGTANVTQSKPISGLSPNTAYHYRLSVTTNAGTVAGTTVDFTTPPLEPPTVSTNPAVSVTQTSATAGGSINPNGTAATCQFEYGVTVAYGKVEPCKVNPGAGTGVVAQQVQLIGLAPGTAYHYRLVGVGGGGTAYGADQAFTTIPPGLPPPQPPSPPVTTPKPLTCKRGFKKMKVHGKLKCVKKKRHRKHR